ncbi:sulfatase-like hydrolase/transferase [Lentisphaera marina]|uniref:sulfatase-like hydrolase/transferase n=1 Tax=Lentisphaera marina TaxID=1111041 RepID=UPI002366D61D|nr:sulfatase-like hydrolase/transferase [Lentisphaera marina]MDD7985239.1 sulfatase-like hydrolase/transferase [Lentisphaera marina]
MKKLLITILLLPFVSLAQDKPNILLIIADDLGYNDVSFTAGSNAIIKTPAIDRIAFEGVKLNNFLCMSSMFSHKSWHLKWPLASYFRSDAIRHSTVA